VPIEDLAEGAEREEMFEALGDLLSVYPTRSSMTARAAGRVPALVDFARRSWAWQRRHAGMDRLSLGRDGEDPLSCR